MFKQKLLIIPGTFFLLGFMPYSGTIEDNAQIPFSGPILEFRGVEKMMDKEFYRDNHIRELPDSHPGSEIPPILLEQLPPLPEIEEI